MKVYCKAKALKNSTSGGFKIGHVYTGYVELGHFTTDCDSNGKSNGWESANFSLSHQTSMEMAIEQIKKEIGL